MSGEAEEKNRREERKKEARKEEEERKRGRKKGEYNIRKSGKESNKVKERKVRSHVAHKPSN